jgi:hypothetical protein
MDRRLSAVLTHVLAGHTRHRRCRSYGATLTWAQHGRLKARLGPMQGLKQERSTSIVIAGHAFVQNRRRGHYELAVDELVTRRVAVGIQRVGIGDLMLWREGQRQHAARQPDATEPGRLGDRAGRTLAMLAETACGLR